MGFRDTKRAGGADQPSEEAAAPSHLGPLLDARVRQEIERRPVGDPDRDLVRAHLDPLHYLLQVPELVDHPDVDLVDHYLEHGVERDLSPHPDFSTGEYLRRHPRRATAGGAHPYVNWLRQGRSAGDVADPAPRPRRLAQVLDRDPAEVVDLVVARRDDLQQRLRHGRLGEMFAQAAEIEPLIGEAWPEITRPRLLPLTHPQVVEELSAIHRAHQAAGFRRARLVFVINRGRWGGGRRMEGHIAHALAGDVDPEDMLVVYTDESSEAPPGRYPSGTREIDFAAITRPLSKEAAEHALVMVLRSLGAEAIVNVNSRMLYHAMRTYGRALAVSERVFLVFFCHEQTSLGTWRGWGLRYFYRTFEHVAGVVTDSEHLAEELASTYRLDEEQRRRLHVFRAPVDPELPVMEAPAAVRGRRPQVFWAGRWDRQKRIDLFLEVARRLPEVDFRMWGEPVLGGADLALPDNVTSEGRYAHFGELPLVEADVWLYTSAWDGVPSLLLEVAMSGVPLVGTRVGGTGEVLDEDGAWPVEESAGAEAYVAALRAVLDDPEAARCRAAGLRERLVRERTAEDFRRHATAVLLAPSPGPGGA